MKDKLNEIMSIIAYTEKNIDNLKVYMVVNVKGKTDSSSDYSNYSITTEFLSNSELNEILLAFRKCSIYTEVIFGEDEFINKVLNTNIINISENILVYNAAQNGTGPGRKALIPSFCNLHNIPVTGSNAYVVSLCRHKYHVNKLLESHNILVAKSWLYDATQGGWLKNRIPPNGTVVIAKPIYESASIGIGTSSRFAFSNEKIDFLNNLSLEMNQPIIVQEFINGFEVETPVIHYNQKHISVLPIGISWNEDRFLNNKFLTYENIYFDNYSFYNFNDENSIIGVEIIRNSELAARILGISGLGRIDYRINNDGKFYITDVSTNPHITSHSSYYYMFNSLKLNHSDIIKVLIGCAINK